MHQTIPKTFVIFPSFCAWAQVKQICFKYFKSDTNELFLKFFKLCLHMENGWILPISILEISLREWYFFEKCGFSFMFPYLLPPDLFPLFFLEPQIHPNHSFLLISIPFLHFLVSVVHSPISDYHSWHEVNSAHFLSFPIGNKTRFSRQTEFKSYILCFF